MQNFGQAEGHDRQVCRISARGFARGQVCRISAIQKAASRPGMQPACSFAIRQVCIILARHGGL